MARTPGHVEEILREIRELDEVDRCELLERLALQHRAAELNWARMVQIRDKLPRRSDREVKRDVDKAVRQVRRERHRAR
jgi:hypothetical protein